MTKSSHSGTARAILYAFLANGGIALAKTWAALVTGSGSMLAEAIHSYADTGNQVLLYLGLKQARKPPDDEHPLGYGKLSYFWSFIVALLLFSLGGLFSIFEGIHKLNNPEALADVWIAIAVLIVAIVLEGFSLAGCLREIRVIRGDRPFRQWLKHTRNSELVVVLGEDVAALLGLALALLFISLAELTGNTMFDAIGSMCIGVVLIVISVFLTMRIQSLLVGRSADPEIREVIADIINHDERVDELFNVITLQFGPDTFLAAKVRLTPGIEIDAAATDINNLERRLKKDIPDLKWCFIEPDITD
jgi:cation diffusion facilitator family transporter